MIYLDNAATTKISPEVLDAMMPYLTEEYGNPGAMYRLGRQAAGAVAKARQQVADFINAKPEQIIFTSGGSEANSLAFFGLAPYLIKENKKHIIVSKTEHESVLKAARNLCVKYQFGATFVGVNESGVVDLGSLEDCIQQNTGLVSVMHTNNEVGAVNPVVSIKEICKRNGVLFHTDCVQAAGSSPINVDTIGCDFLSLSSHKIHGSKGCGALFVKDAGLLEPVIFGGDEQEFGIRGGTENVPGIVGFGMACEVAKRDFNTNTRIVTNLKCGFHEALIGRLSYHGLSNILHLNGSGGKISNLRFDGIDTQTLLLMLDSVGVCVSAGSACRSLESSPSHVLLAMGLSDEEARSSVRISFSTDQSYDEVASAAEIIADCVSQLHNMER